jgi:hypothetical protein
MPGKPQRTNSLSAVVGDSSDCRAGLSDNLRQPASLGVRPLPTDSTRSALRCSMRIQARYGPDLSERELRLRLAALWLDRETMIDAFGWDPEVEGY